MYKEIFNQPFFENSNRHMNEGLTLLIAIPENRYQHENRKHDAIYRKIDNSTKTDNTMLIHSTKIYYGTTRGKSIPLSSFSLVINFSSVEKLKRKSIHVFKFNTKGFILQGKEIRYTICGIIVIRDFSQFFMKIKSNQNQKVLFKVGTFYNNTT